MFKKYAKSERRTTSVQVSAGTLERLKSYRLYLSQSFPSREDIIVFLMEKFEEYKLTKKIIEKLGLSNELDTEKQEAKPDE